MSTSTSPKNVKLKAPTPGNPMFGCASEHVQRLFTQNQEVMSNAITHYKETLKCIFDQNPMLAQSSKPLEGGQQFTNLTPLYLCLQCTDIMDEGDIVKHAHKKQHRFYVESQTGTLYCQLCDDIVWDPTLEELRIRKIGTGSFATSRKRKIEEISNDPAKDDPRHIPNNTMLAPCKANGLRGIYNAGATCYQNVILQSFLHNPILRNFYLCDGHRSNDCSYQHCISCAMDDIFQEFYGQEQTNGYTAANVLSSFWISDKKAFENLVTTKEQDAHEFFQFLAEELHERNRNDKKLENGGEHSCDCIVHHTFYGKLQSTTTCQNCQGVTNATESFLDLSLGLENLAQKRGKKTGAKPPSLALQECLEEEYIKQDKCEYRCHNCNSMQQARRQTSIKELPNVLSIQLKRFEYKQGRHDKACKIDTPIQFPLQLNMLPYTDTARNQDVKTSFELARACTYELMAVVVHVGELDTGHYISYCRVGDQWFSFNDHRVELANKSDVLGSQAYLLFYIVKSIS
ncbi:putative ubiquitin carboxyl-terminal hydrolase 8 [Zalerion maritima]|uniref:Ubiquitin carboxyl-terminal hydrolase 8 n=1 Tax=Zalerion maritima TaxID=339359 RepID=A0AAD5WPL0_9PEZI|nr:putative ubiquitin carboxyl-terminal hydrolase 8 [Zalerion maritima]